MSMVTHAYVARSECGCVCGAVADDPAMKQQTAKDVAAFVRSGNTVTRMTMTEVRVLTWGCSHEPKWKKSSRVEPGM